MTQRHPCQAAAFDVRLGNPRDKPITIGPIGQLTFDGKRLLADGGQLLATHINHRWQMVNGGAYAVLECPHRIEVRYQNHDGKTARTLGPYRSLSEIDGIVYADSRIICFCDEQHKDWYSYDLGTHWQALVVTKAAR